MNTSRAPRDKEVVLADVVRPLAEHTGKGGGSTKRIFLVDDHAAFRRSMELLIGAQPDLEVAGWAGSMEEGLRFLSNGHGFEVAVVDLWLPDGDGSELIRPLRKAAPGSSILVLTADSDYGRALEAGADEVLSKQSSFVDILAAIRRYASFSS